MCAIVGSKNFGKFKELLELNSYRGSHSYSVAEYSISTGRLELKKRGLGEINFDKIQFGGGYYIGHIQAPTTASKNKSNIHPSKLYRDYLWHNGILKHDSIQLMKEQLNLLQENWDTKLLHFWLRQDKDLSEIDGTFSCLRYLNYGLYLFRNEISPMYIDRDMSISSTKFENSLETPANAYLYLDLIGDRLDTLYEFETKENPYYFG